MTRRLLPLVTLLLLAACASGNSPAASRWNTSTPSEPPMRVFESTDYGFGFAYPQHLVERTGERDHEIFAANDPLVRGENTLSIRIHPLAEYRFENIFDDTYRYDAEHDSWHAIEANEPFVPDQVTIGGETFVVFGMGDAGHFIETYVLPHESKGVMIEFRFERCLSCVEGDVPAQEEIEMMIQHVDEDARRILESVSLES